MRSRIAQTRPETPPGHAERPRNVALLEITPARPSRGRPWRSSAGTPVAVVLGGIAKVQVGRRFSRRPSRVMGPQADR
jgi:hypothetical protein